MFGKSDKRRQRDQAEARELREARQSQTKELLKLQQEQVDDSRKQALLALEEARNIAVLRQKSLDETSNLWRVTSDALLKSAKSLDTSNRLLSQLGNEKLDLVRAHTLQNTGIAEPNLTDQAKTKEIIETSLEHLTVFRHQIDSMLSYFTENAEYVEKLTAPTGQLGKILSTIEAISKASGNKDKARLMPNLEFDAEDKDVSSPTTSSQGMRSSSSTNMTLGTCSTCLATRRPLLSSLRDCRSLPRSVQEVHHPRHQQDGGALASRQQTIQRESPRLSEVLPRCEVRDRRVVFHERGEGDRRKGRQKYVVDGQGHEVHREQTVPRRRRGWRRFGG